MSGTGALVGGGFGHRHLHVHGSSPVHRLTPQAKIVGLCAFVVVVALTPRELFGAFALDAAVVVAAIAVAGLRPAMVASRLTAVVPFVAFAVLLPFIGDGEQVRVAGVAMSVDGLWSAWNVVAKAVLGASASIVLTATTPIPDIISGLTRLRVPAVFVGIIAFMFRYLDLIVDQFGRMRRAMVARGHDPRWIWQARPIASSTGTLFVRTYERGERVHDAMAARGFTGQMPDLAPPTVGRAHLVPALIPALVAAAGTLGMVL